jgi:hypothetical protein
MKCPHCATAIHENWSLTQFWDNWFASSMKCPECELSIIRIQRAVRQLIEDAWIQVFPRGSSRAPVSTDVPPAIAQDYKEAAMVLALSAKASAALSRRCLQAILHQAGYTQHDLSKQIDAVLVETDARKALATGPHSMLDAIRNFGNFSAHPITDQTTLQVIDVEDHEAEYCLDILDCLFDHYYVRVEEAKRRRAALDAKLSAAGKPLSKQ